MVCSSHSGKVAVSRDESFSLAKSEQDSGSLTRKLTFLVSAMVSPGLHGLNGRTFGTFPHLDGFHATIKPQFGRFGPRGLAAGAQMAESCPMHAARLSYQSTRRSGWPIQGSR
jgi:hypothetical protein